jgi:hypothetical protein
MTPITRKIIRITIATHRGKQIVIDQHAKELFVRTKKAVTVSQSRTATFMRLPPCVTRSAGPGLPGSRGRRARRRVPHDCGRFILEIKTQAVALRGRLVQSIHGAARRSTAGAPVRTPVTGQWAPYPGRN